MLLVSLSYGVQDGLCVTRVSTRNPHTQQELQVVASEGLLNTKESTVQVQVQYQVKRRRWAMIAVGNHINSAY